jgi:hypothetical protein
MDGKEVVDRVSAEEYQRLRWHGPGRVEFSRSAPEFDLSIFRRPAGSWPDAVGDVGPRLSAIRGTGVDCLHGQDARRGNVVAR